MSTVAPLRATRAKPAGSDPERAMLLQRKCACGASAKPLLRECEDCGKTRLQRKLAIGATNDPLEREADRIADQVLSAPEHSAPGTGVPRMRRSPAPLSGGSLTAPASVERVLAHPGQPVDAPLRGDMEQRFGHDFSQVRVHTGADAALSAREVGAQAYTVGHDIVFDRGRYTSQSPGGRALLAHELAHVVQQESAGSAVLHRQEAATEMPVVPHLTLPRLSLFGPAEGEATLEGFVTGSAEISDDHRDRLRALAANLRGLLDRPPGGRVHVVGHTDRVGTEADNDTLGRDRANAVRDELVRLGIDAADILSASLGESVPAVDTERAEPRNRRVSVSFSPSSGLNFRGVLSGGLRPPEPLRPTPPVDIPGVTRPYDPCVLSPELCRPREPRRDYFTPLPPLPERRLPSVSDAIWRPIDRALERGLRDLGLGDEWNQRLRDAARAGAGKAATELLDQAMDAAHLQGETREAVGTALRAAIQLEVPF